MLTKVVSVVLTGNLQPSCPYSSVFTRTNRFSGGKGSSCPGFYKSPHAGSPWIGGSSLGDSAKRLVLHIIRLIVKSPLGRQLLLHYPYIPSVLPWGHHIIGAGRLGLKMGACLYSQLLRFQKPARSSIPLSLTFQIKLNYFKSPSLIQPIPCPLNPSHPLPFLIYDL